MEWIVLFFVMWFSIGIASFHVIMFIDKKKVSGYSEYFKYLGYSCLGGVFIAWILYLEYIKK